MGTELSADLPESRATARHLEAPIRIERYLGANCRPQSYYSCSLPMQGLFLKRRWKKEADKSRPNEQFARGSLLRYPKVSR
jgi:hypothetical protein